MVSIKPSSTSLLAIAFDKPSIASGSAYNAFFRAYSLLDSILDKMEDNKKENLITYMKSGKIDFVINIPWEQNIKNEITSWYLLRRLATDSSIPMINNIEVAMLYIKSIMLLDWYEKIKILPYSYFKK